MGVGPGDAAQSTNAAAHEGANRPLSAVGLALALAGLACGGDASATGPDASGGDASATGPDASVTLDAAATPDAGELLPARPALTPCPEGWEERFDQRLAASWCEPWPDSSPVRWACPTGWRESLTEGVATCEPYPEESADACSETRAHYPGTPGCSTVGEECPSGPFPEGLPADASIVYVQPGFEGGDGTSPASPLGSLDAVGLAQLPSGTVVALAKGVHRWTGVLSRPVTLWGACAAETILTSPEPLPPSPPLVLVKVASPVNNGVVVLKNLRVSDTGPQGGLQVTGRMPLRLEGVIIERTPEYGLWVTEGGRLFGSDLVVRDVGEGSQSTHRGIEVGSGGSAQLTRAVVERTKGVGAVAVGTGSRLILADAVIRDTRGESQRNPGRGMDLFGGATAEARRVVFERNREMGILVHSDSRLILEDAVVRDTQARATDGRQGRALEVLGALAEVRRAAFVRNRNVSVHVEGLGARLVLEDVVVRDTLRQEEMEPFGRGLEIVAGGAADVRRTVFDRYWDVGVAIDGPGSQLDMESVLIREVQSRDGQGLGLTIKSGASANLRAVALLQNTLGITVFDADTRLVLADAVIVYRPPTGAAWPVVWPVGRGLQVLDSQVEVRRTRIEGRVDIGIIVRGPEGRLDLEDVVVRDAESDAFGRGLAVQAGARVDVRRSAFLDLFDIAVTADGGTLTLTDTVVLAVEYPPCAMAARACEALASGVVSTDGGILVLARVLISAATQCGVYSFGGGQIDGTEVVLAENGAGACFDDALYDVGRLGAEFRANGADIVFENLPTGPRSLGD